MVPRRLFPRSGVLLRDSYQEHAVPRRIFPGAHHSSQAVQPAEKAVQFAAKPNAGVVEITIPRRLFPGAYHSREKPKWEMEGPGVEEPHNLVIMPATISELA